MFEEEGKLSDKDHKDMDAFLGILLDSYKAGTLKRATAIGTLAHVIAAADIDNHEEARKWFQQGQKSLSNLQDS
jgi:aminopeptidase C